MWINTRDNNPENDGFYLVQMTTGEINGLSYTKAGGWNTFYNLYGNLNDESQIGDLSVARWFDAPNPPEVPDEWWEDLVAWNHERRNQNEGRR